MLFGIVRSQATWPSGWPPASASNNCAAVSIELRAWVSTVPAAACGVATKVGSVVRGWSRVGGSA
jgi:hypothetical protein